MPGDRELEHRVADAVHLRDREQQQPEQDAANGWPQPVRAAVPQPVSEILACVEDAHEAEPHTGREHAEAGVEQQLER